MSEREAPDNHDLGPLRPLVDAVRADLPDEAQWQAAHDRLLQRLAHAGEHVRADHRRGETFLGPDPSVGAVVVGFTPWLNLALVATMMAVAFYFTQWRRPGGALEVGRVEAVEGTCVRLSARGQEHRLVAGNELCAGDRLRVGPEAHLRLRARDGSLLWLCDDTEAVCMGPRSAASPALRLVRGEIRAKIAPSPGVPFGIETPAAALRVFGTEFHLRVLPEVGQLRQEEKAMGSGKMQNALVVLTVLSGAVAIDAAGREQMVKGGERAVVVSGQTPGTAEKVENLDYLRTWLGKRLRNAERERSQEILVDASVRGEILRSLLAVDVRSGKWRPIASFFASELDAADRRNAEVTVVGVTSPIWNYDYREPVGGAEHPVSSRVQFLVDLRTGEMLPFWPLRRHVVFDAELSPDWRQLAFDSYSYEKRDRRIRLLNLETFQITDLPKNVGSFAWSPDSRWLAYSQRTPSVASRAEVVILDSLTGKTKQTGWQGEYPRFTRDGEHLVFVQEKQTGGGRGAGNLFRAALPQGPRKQLTQLSNAAVVFPSFSPDGTRLLYWESPPEEKDNYGDKTLHIVDLDTGKDRVIATFYYAAWGDAPSIQWLDGNAQFVVKVVDQPANTDLSDATKTLVDYPVTYHWVTLDRGEPSIRALKPPQTLEPRGAAEWVADRLARAIAAYRAAARAECLHALDDAQARYAEARDLLDAVLGDLHQGAKPLNLHPADLQRYRDAMDQLASLDKAERTFQIVSANLRAMLPAVLKQYYCGLMEMPEEHRAERQPARRIAAIRRNQPPHRLDLEDCAREAPGKHWLASVERFCINGEDVPLARRLFVVPGDDPDQVLTSFEVVRPDGGDGLLVIRTPVLPNGKRLEATYRIKAVHQTSWKPEWEWAEMETTVTEIADTLPAKAGQAGLPAR